VVDPEAYKYILIQKKYKKQEVFSFVTELLLNGGISGYNVDTEKWKFSRKLLSPMFNPQVLKKMNSRIFSHIEERTINLLDGENSKTFDNFFEKISQITLTIIIKVVFGTNMEFLEEFGKSYNDTIANFPQVLFQIILFGQWITKVSLPWNKNFFENKAKVEAEVKKLIQSKKQENEKTTDYLDLLSIMINANDEFGNKFTEDQLLSESLVILLF
jgi:cytochrome P450 family 110